MVNEPCYWNSKHQLNIQYPLHGLCHKGVHFTSQLPKLRRPIMICGPCMDDDSSHTPHVSITSYLYCQMTLFWKKRARKFMSLNKPNLRWVTFIYQWPKKFGNIIPQLTHASTPIPQVKWNYKGISIKVFHHSFRIKNELSWISKHEASCSQRCFIYLQKSKPKILLKALNHSTHQKKLFMISMLGNSFLFFFLFLFIYLFWDPTIFDDHIKFWLNLGSDL